MLARLIRSEPVYLFFRSPGGDAGRRRGGADHRRRVFAPWIARTNPYDLSTFSLMDGLLPPVWQGGDPRFPAWDR